MDINKLVQKQRTFYNANNTLSYEFRLTQLKKLREAIYIYEKRIEEALFLDLGKHGTESYLSEIGLSLKEITYMIKHLKSFIKDKKVPTALVVLPASCYRSPHPYGVTLVMSPWNYPFYLTIGPLIGAIAAGNTCVLKPSDYSHNTSVVIKDMIQKTFPEEYVSVITGGRDKNQALLEQKFDYIFFTGGKVVGRIVMEKAAKNLTPVTLELGGKSPCIVTETAPLKLSAKRIVFGKYLNAGQTCVAPDYMFLHESVKDEFIQHMKEAIHDKFGDEPIKHELLGKVINEKHFLRLKALLENQDIITGGDSDLASNKIAPTLLSVKIDNVIMEDEIFGPILPIITYNNIQEVIDYVNSREKPLALYLFSTEKSIQKKVHTECNFGGGCINDCILQSASPYLPFGGVGESGMGAYHGRASFETFSHYRSIVKKANWLDPSLRYHPYTKTKHEVIKKILK